VDGEYRTYRWGSEPTEPTPNPQRVTVREAAVLLGISEGAVRMRVKRGTLPSTREGGRLYVLLNIKPTPEPERPHAGTHDRTSELISTLREQLEAERQAHAEARRIIAGLVDRMPPQLEAPQETPPEARGSPTTGEEDAQSSTSGSWSGMFHEARTAAITTVVTQAVGAAVAAFSYVQGELRLFVGVITLQVLLLAGTYFYVRRRVPIDIEPVVWRPNARNLLIGSVVVALLVFFLVVFLAQPKWAGL
jgi:excisionase family DNA binding protein